MENIWVGIRVRPHTPQEHDNCNVCSVYHNTISLCTPSITHSFSFDNVFGSDASNQDVYQVHPKRLAMDVVNGFNGTMFAYGQTNSGKTYTMHGTSIDPGIIPLAVIDMFGKIKMITSREFLIRVSFMEIYNEEIKDLLCPENCKLEIHENQERGVFVAGLKEVVVNGPQQVLDILQTGEVHRHFGETNMNANSSRSHAIFRMVIESKGRANQSTTDTLDSDVVQVSTLHMVDLAGFERISKTGADGFRLREGTYINKSLVTLSNVIKKLSDGVKTQGGHIPYRDSKLTRILQSVLGGNAKMSIICNVSPGQAHIEETRSTLLFASRAKKVTTFAHVNEVMSDAALLKRQQKEIEELRGKLKGTIGEDMEKEVLKLRNELLKFELEREKLALQLEEEKKSQAEKEQRIREQEQTIENLSTMVMSCSSNINTSKRTMQKISRLHTCEGTPGSITIRNEPDCALPRFEDLLGGVENRWCLPSNEEFLPQNFVSVADDDTWIGLNNVTTYAPPMMAILSSKDGQQVVKNMEITNSIKVDSSQLEMQKLLEENAQLKAQLAEKTMISNAYKNFIIRILELQDEERRMKSILKETWIQLLRSQENEQNLRKENISLLLSKTRAEMLLDQIRGQLELLEKILIQTSCEHAELDSYAFMVRSMVLTATDHVQSIGDTYSCLQLLQDHSSLEKIDCCTNFSEILEIGQEDLCNIADPDELIMKTRMQDSQIHGFHDYETNLTLSDLTCGDPVFDLVNLQGWGRHLTPEEREIAFKILKGFCIKMERAQALEAKLAAAELHVVELEVEVDDLRARSQVSNLDSPSHIEMELQTLRSQCECYKNEIGFLMEQIPTAEEEAKKRNKFINIKKENIKMHLRVKKLKRQISHVKKWRKELQRLKLVDKEQETLLSRLEETLKRNRRLEQELSRLKRDTGNYTIRRTSSTSQTPKTSHPSQNLDVLEAQVCEAGYTKLDFAPHGNDSIPLKEQTNRETSPAVVHCSLARKQMRPSLGKADVNRANSARKPQVNGSDQFAYNEIANKENMILFGKTSFQGLLDSKETHT